jgi:hypothetical protein
MSRITAPWDAETIRTLNYQQGVGYVHPYTCGKCGDDLRATQAGWICPGTNGDPLCDYTQNWAHEPPSIAQLEAMNPSNFLATKDTQ